MIKINLKSKFLVSIFTLLVQQINCEAVFANQDSLSSLTASRPAESLEKSEALDSVLELLSTKIATRTTEQTTDIAPGVITILEKDYLIRSGVRTLYEALTLIPGFDKSEPQINDDEPVLRGVGGIYTGPSSRIRYMVNGIITNNTISANSSLALQMPVEQIKRIEVIRGPGSAIYGEYALLGVINVVTNDEGNHLYGRAGSFGTRSAGGYFKTQHSPDLSSSFDLSYWQTDGPDVDSGPDLLHSLGQPEASNAPGQPNLSRRYLSGFYKLSAPHWSVAAFLLADERGDGYGAANALSLPQRYAQTAEQYGLEFMADNKFDSWNAEYRLAIKQFRRENLDLLVLPVNAFGIYPIGFFGNSSEGENRYEIGVDLSRLQGKHTQLLGFEITRSKATGIKLEATGDGSNTIPGLQLPAPLPELTAQPLGLEGRSRTIQSAYISDQYQINANADIVAGLRFDEYSDINESTMLSPRLAGSYRLSENHLFKLQYARAFRPPSFSELYYLIGTGPEGPAGNPDLISESIDTLELAYSFRRPDKVIRTTIYSSRISDLIRVDESLRFQNSADAKTKGVEVDFEYHHSFGFKWFGNVSYQDARNSESDEPLEGSANWLGNLGLTYQPRGRYATTVRLQYVGDRHRSTTDTREDLDSYTVVSVNGLINDFLSPGLRLRFGVNNLFDSDTRNPAQALTYEQDFPGSGREIWLQLTKSFD